MLQMIFDTAALPKDARGLASSKTGRAAVVGVLWLSLCIAPAQNYSIDWHSIDGGGGTSTGGVYSVSGSVGQPDAGTLSGGNYSLAGGFWGIVTAIQTPDAPLMTIRRTQTNTVIISWPAPSTGFFPQQSPDLDSPNWVTPAEAINNDDTNNFIIVNPRIGNRFYRLFKP